MATPVATISKRLLQTYTKSVVVAGSKWYNELGSVMTINTIDCDKGNFGGTYSSAVGQAEKEYAFCGRFDNDGRSLGWIVSWNNKYQNAHSTTGWSGQLQLDPHTFEPTILTTWLLTTQSDPNNDWQSTHVGSDTFTQTPPEKEHMERAKQRCQCSHPKAAAE